MRLDRRIAPERKACGKGGCIMSDIFEAAKMLDMRTVAEYYGLSVNRHGRGLCPFHSEKTPSFTAYPDGRGFYCYGCGNGGDAITFVSKLFDLSPIESLKRLNADFTLGLDFDSPIDTETIKKRRAEVRLVKDFDEWEKYTFRIVCRFSHVLKDAIHKLAPKSPDDEPNPAWVYALSNISRIEYWLEILTFGDYQEKIQFYKNAAEEVNAID